MESMYVMQIKSSHNTDLTSDIDDEPLLIFEELKTTYPSWTCDINTKLAKERIPYIKAVHIIKPAQTQVYIVNKLHMVRFFVVVVIFKIVSSKSNIPAF